MLWRFEVTGGDLIDGDVSWSICRVLVVTRVVAARVGEWHSSCSHGSQFVAAQ